MCPLRQHRICDSIIWQLGIFTYQYIVTFLSWYILFQIYLILKKIIEIYESFTSSPFVGIYFIMVNIVVQSLSHLSVGPWAIARQASLSFTISQSLLKLMSIESMMPSNHLILFLYSALNLSQHQGLFQWVGFLHQVAKVLELQLQHQSFQCIFRVNFL